MLKPSEKFQILWWKNWKCQLQRKKQLISEILILLIIISSLILIRFSTSYVVLDEKTYSSFDIECKNAELDKNYENVIGYSPSNNSKIDKIMSYVLESLNKTINSTSGLKLWPVKNSSTLDQTLYTNHEIFLGIEFSDELSDMGVLPNMLEYSIKFKKFHTDWNTERISRAKVLSGLNIETRNYDTGISRIYLDNCFLMIQSVIDQSFMKLQSGQAEMSIPTIKLQRFSERKFADDPFKKIASFAAPGLIFLFFIYVAYNIIREVGKEQEKCLRSYLLVHGVSKKLQWLSWFTKEISLTLIYSLAIVISLTLIFQGPYEAVLYYSNPVLLLLFLITFLMPLITLAFLITLFFAKAKGASILALFVYGLSIIPFFVISLDITYENNYDVVKNFLSCLLPGSGIGFGFSTIFALEYERKGLTFSTFFERTSNNGLSVALVMLAFLFDTILSVFLIAYMECVYSEFPKTRNFIPTIKYIWNSIFQSGDHSTVHDNGINNGLSEPNWSIQTRNLMKAFKGNKKTTNNLSLQIAKNDITVIFGENDSGKSTLIHMICGLCTPSSGIVNLAGRSVTDENDISDLIGIALQSHELIGDIKSEEYLEMFAKLKGMKVNESKNQAKEILEELDLKAGVFYRDLSIEQKKKLAIAIAFCGNPEIILLDEPAQKLDSSDRQAVREFIRNHKDGKSILITTSSPNEAEIIADNIIVLKDGKAEFEGTLAEMKRKHGIGHQIICRKNLNFNIQMTANILSNFKILYESETEISFLCNAPISKLSNAVRELENSADELGIKNFTISERSFESVFVGLEKPAIVTSKDRTNGASNELSENDTIIETNQASSFSTVTGPKLLFSQFFALMKKKLYFYLRTYKNDFLYLIISLSICVFYMWLSGQDLYTPSYEPLSITLQNYTDKLIYIQSNNQSTTEQFYKDLVEKSSQVIDVPMTSNMSEFVLNSERNDYVIGATFENTTITGWFNDLYFHSQPLAVNMIYQALIKDYVGMNFGTVVTNNPFFHDKWKYIYSSRPVQLVMDEGTYLIFLSIFYIWTLKLCRYYVKERTSGVKNMQYNFGLSKLLYVSSNVIVDLICTSIFNVICFGHAYGFAFIVAFYWHSLNFMYLVTMFLKKSFNSKALLTFTYIVFGVFLIFINYGFLNMRDIYYEDDDNYIPVYKYILEYVSKLSPLYMTFGFPRIFFLRNTTGHIFYGFILFGIILAIEYNLYGMIRRRLSKQNSPEDLHKSQILEIANEVKGSNAANEIEHIFAMSPAEIGQYALVIRNLSGGNPEDFTNLSIMSDNHSCLGIITDRKSVRIAIFNLLTGQEELHKGDIYLNNSNMRINPDAALKFIGYCSENGTLMNFLTGRESLEAYGVLRGYDKRSVQEEIKNLSNDLNLRGFLDKSVKTYSETKRKLLGIAMAFFGNPRVVILDEPFAGFDSSSKNLVSSLIQKNLNEGKVVVITSTSLKDCESVCTKLVIVQNGRMKYLDSMQNLKAQNLNSFKIEINFKGPTRSGVADVKKFISQLFPGIILSNESPIRLSYTMKTFTMKWSNILDILENLKENFNIENYSILENSLESFC